MSMPGSFNDEFGDDEQAPAAAVTRERPQAQFAPRPPVVVLPPDPMVEVSRRLDMAACYQVLVAEDLFEQETFASKIVQEEDRAFIYGRLQALVNIGVAPTAPFPGSSEFSHDEVLDLNPLAHSLMSRKSPAPSPAKPPDPKPLKGKKAAEKTPPKPQAPIEVKT